VFGDSHFAVFLGFFNVGKRTRLSGDGKNCAADTATGKNKQYNCISSKYS